jgi:hypothetical protein
MHGVTGRSFFHPWTIGLLDLHYFPFNDGPCHLFEAPREPIWPGCLVWQQRADDTSNLLLSEAVLEAREVQRWHV